MSAQLLRPTVLEVSSEVQIRIAARRPALATAQMACAQGASMTLPKAVEAGAAFSIQSTGSGKAVLYIVGLGQVLRRDVQLGETAFFPAGSLYNAGHYLAILVGGSTTDSGSFDVTAANQPAALSFLAKPSRLSVGLHDGISGAVYVFDAFQQSDHRADTGVFSTVGQYRALSQARTVVTRDGSAWTEMDSTAKEGTAQFVARVDGSFQRPRDRAGSGRSLRVEDERPASRASSLRLENRSGARLQRQRRARRNDRYFYGKLRRHSNDGGRTP